MTMMKSHRTWEKEFLRLLVVTMNSRLVTTRGYHVLLPQVVGRKRKPQIDSTYKVRNLYIKDEENEGTF